MSEDNTGSNWRDALDRYESPFNTTRMFTGLEPHLPQPEKKRRRAAFWWQRLALLAVLLLGGTWLLWPDKSAIDDSEALVDVKSLQLDAATSGEGNQGQNKDAVHSPIKTTSSDGASDFKSRAANAKTHHVHSETSTLSGADTDHITPTPSSHQKASDIFSDIAHVEETSTMAFPSIAYGIEDDNSSQTSEVNAVEQIQRAIPPQNEADALPGLPGLLNSPERLDEAVSSKKALPPLVLSKSRKSWQLHLDMMGGVGFPSRSMMAAALENTDFLTIRRSTETMIGAWNTGVDLRLYSPIGLFIQSGIRYHTITERFDWQSSVEDYRYDLVEGMLLGIDGQLTPYQDSAWHRISSSRIVRHYNHIRTWDIPIALGYRHVWGPLSGDVAIGLQFNLNQSVEGRSLNPQGSPAYWNSEDALRYRSRIDMGAMLQGRLVWHPTPVFGIFIQPVLHLQPGSRTDESTAGYKLEFQTFYLQTGVSVRLF